MRKTLHLLNAISYSSVLKFQIPPKEEKVYGVYFLVNLAWLKIY